MQVDDKTKKQVNQKPTHPKLLGATFGDIEQSAPYYGNVNGVMIYELKRGSPAWASGLRKNDIITSVNRQTITNLEDFKSLVQHNNALLLNITRNGRAMFLLLS